MVYKFSLHKLSVTSLCRQNLSDSLCRHNSSYFSSPLTAVFLCIAHELFLDQFFIWLWYFNTLMPCHSKTNTGVNKLFYLVYPSLFAWTIFKHSLLKLTCDLLSYCSLNYDIKLSIYQPDIKHQKDSQSYLESPQFWAIRWF